MRNTQLLLENANECIMYVNASCEKQYKVDILGYIYNYVTVIMITYIGIGNY